MRVRKLLRIKGFSFIVVTVTVLATVRIASATSLGDGLSLGPFSQTVMEFQPAVAVADNFATSGTLNGSTLQISGRQMPATTTAAPSWAAATDSNQFTQTANTAIRNASVSSTNQYSAARFAWLNRKFSLTGTLTQISTATNAGFLVLAANNGRSGVVARFLRSPNNNNSSDRWKVQIVRINSVSSGVANLSVLAEQSLFNNSTSNPTSNTVTITMSFDPTASTNLTVTATDPGGHSASTSATVSTSAGLYAGLVSFTPSPTRYSDFEVQMT